MWVSWTRLVFYVCFSHAAIHFAAADYASTNFTNNHKPLQCHAIKSVAVRSEVDCALHCMADLYSCAGYVLDRNENTCDVCFIYDVTTPLVTVNRPQGSASCVRDIHRENNGRIV